MTEAQAWLRVAKHIDTKRRKSIDCIFTCHVIQFHLRNSIPADVRALMLDRIELDLDGASVAYGDNEEYNTANSAEYNKARVLAALMFAHEAQYEYAASLGLEDLLVR